MGLKRDDPFALGQHDAPECRQGLAAHRLPDHRKGLLPDRIVGGNVIGRIEIALVNLGARHEAVDITGMRARDLDGLQLLILDGENGVSSMHRIVAGVRHGNWKAAKSRILEGERGWWLRAAAHP
jgi:hypothetical protein